METKTDTIKEIEKEKHLVCGYCPAMIYWTDEPNGEYHYLDELPICARCRILKGSKKAKEIIADKDRVVEDLKTKNDLRQKKANDLAIDVAIATQEETKDLID